MQMNEYIEQKHWGEGWDRLSVGLTDKNYST